MSKVTLIPSTKNPHTKATLGARDIRNVAAYARVSTNTDEQYSSYEAQVNYYMKFIQDRADWRYINVYADEGITGTNTKKRLEFNKMISDALSGKIDLIITKSISRFARNTLDTISYVRKLKDKGIEVFFEKENLWTLDPKSELILTIMASIAQEESRSISENVRWGKRVAFKQGKVTFAYSRFLGYKKENDKLVIDEDEAIIVRLIYRMFLVDGISMHAIAHHLNASNVKTPSGKGKRWIQNTIASILTNEKYKGDALLQKSYNDNYLTQKQVKNTGQIPQYYVENNHPAIIDKDMWELTQILVKQKTSLGKHNSFSSTFASKLICADCGGFYGRKRWHSTDKYSKLVYRCNRKFDKGKHKCMTPTLSEEEIQMKFIQAYNFTMKDKKRVMDDTKEIIELLSDTKDIDVEINKTGDEITVITELVNKLINDHAKTNMSLEEYDRRYSELTIRYEELEIKKNELINKRDDKKARVYIMNEFLSNLKHAKDKMSEWNDSFFTMMVESGTVYRDETITFKLKNGFEV
ncbi:MAG: recombinase family protein [Acholeplasmataceae bacterium]